jgi:hypothetical protein
MPSNIYDVVLSNCVLNLVPDKNTAFNEISSFNNGNIGIYALQYQVIKNSYSNHDITKTIKIS